MSVTTAQAAATVPATAHSAPATKGTPIGEATHGRLKELADWNDRTIRAHLERMINESYETERSVRDALAKASAE